MVVVVEVMVIGVLTDVEMIMVGVIVIVLNFFLPVLYSLDGMAVDLFMGALAGVMLGVLSGLGIEVLADVSANAFAVVAALKFPM